MRRSRRQHCPYPFLIFTVDPTMYLPSLLHFSLPSPLSHCYPTSLSLLSYLSTFLPRIHYLYRGTRICTHNKCSTYCSNKEYISKIKYTVNTAFLKHRRERYRERSDVTPFNPLRRLSFKQTPSRNVIFNYFIKEREYNLIMNLKNTNTEFICKLLLDINAQYVRF